MVADHMSSVNVVYIMARILYLNVQTINHSFCFEILDSIREMNRYSIGKVQDSEHGHLDAELQHSMKLFRAQRNFYVAGFALFLYLYVSHTQE